MISGHEDGCVRFWNAGTSALSLLYTFKTNQFFSTEDEAFEDVGNHAEEEEEEWPPFRKVCSMHIYWISPLCENIIASLKDRLIFKIKKIQQFFALLHVRRLDVLTHFQTTPDCQLEK